MYLTFCFRLGWADVADIRIVSVSWPCVGLFFVWVSFWASGGAAWLLDFVFGVALGYGSRGMGKLGLFVGGCGFWGLGAGALVISDYK